MHAETVPTLDLRELQHGMVGLSPEVGAEMAQAAAVCLEDQEHEPGTTVLTVRGDLAARYALDWTPVTEQMSRTWRDHAVATEQGAYAVAISVMRAAKGLAVTERSRRGTGFDFWLGLHDSLFVQNAARLEVSGIRRGDNAAVRRRLREKAGQLQQRTRVPKGYAVVVEFSRPLAHVEER